MMSIFFRRWAFAFFMIAGLAAWTPAWGVETTIAANGDETAKVPVSDDDAKPTALEEEKTAKLEAQIKELTKQANEAKEKVDNLTKAAQTNADLIGQLIAAQVARNTANDDLNDALTRKAEADAKKAEAKADKAEAAKDKAEKDKKAAQATAGGGMGASGSAAASTAAQGGNPATNGLDKPPTALVVSTQPQTPVVAPTIVESKTGDASKKSGGRDLVLGALPSNNIDTLMRTVSLFQSGGSAPTGIGTRGYTSGGGYGLSAPPSAPSAQMTALNFRGKKAPILADQLVQNPAQKKKQLAARGIASVPKQIPIVVIPPVSLDTAPKASDDYMDMGPGHKPQP